MQVRNIVLRIIVLVFLLIGIISYIPELLGKDNEIIDCYEMTNVKSFATLC